MNVHAAVRLASALFVTVLALKSDDPLIVASLVVVASTSLFLGLLNLKREDDR